MDQYKEIELNKKIKVDNVRDIRAIYDKLVSNEINEQDKLDGELFRKNLSVCMMGQRINIYMLGYNLKPKLLNI